MLAYECKHTSDLTFEVFDGETSVEEFTCDPASTISDPLHKFANLPTAKEAATARCAELNEKRRAKAAAAKA